MIVDYPCLAEIAWIPKGKRRVRGYVYNEPVSIDLRVVDEGDAPVVAVVEQQMYARQETTTYRRVGDDWYRDDEGLTVTEVLADPERLDLCDSHRSYEIARAYDGSPSKSQYDRNVIAQGPLESIKSLADLPEGRAAAVPVRFDRFNGRRDDVLDKVDSVILVGDRVCRRVAEPVLRIEVSHSAAYTFVRGEVVQSMEDAERHATYHRLDAATDLARSFSGDDVIVTMAEIDLVRGDLLQFDPLPGACRAAMTTVLGRVIDKLVDAPLPLLETFAQVRDEMIGDRPYDWSRKAVRIREDIDPDVMYEALVKLVDGYIAMTDGNRNSFRHLVDEIADKLVGTRRHADFKARHPDVFPDAMVIDPSDLAVLTRSFP